MRENNSNRSWLDFAIYFFVKIKRDDIFALAAQLAYYLVLSFFPFIIFLMTLVGFSNFTSGQVLEGLSKILPSSVFDLTSSVVVEAFDNQYTGLLGASILLAVWTASSGFRAVIKGVNKAYDVEENRSFPKRIIIAMISTFLLALTIIMTLAMLVFGSFIWQYISKFLPFNEVITLVWNGVRYTIVVIMMILIFAAIYRYMPAKRIRWREVFPGAIFSTLGWIILSLGFSFYINNFSNYSRLYGSLGAVFILMTWLYLTSMIFILGVEINSVLAKTKKLKEYI